MRNMTLSNIAKACSGKLVAAEPFSDTEAQGVVIDSRKVEPDYVFIATVGERSDGHSFIPDVYKQGALAVVCEKPPENPAGPYILVKSSFEALKRIAAWYRTQLDIPVVGITGSVGKTSTKELVAAVLSQGFNVLKTEGNFNNEVGLPLTVLRIRKEHSAAVLEMGISDFGEMHRLSEIARPDICLLTNIGPCHLENLKTLEGVLRAKSEMFDFMNPHGRICINGDDALLSTLDGTTEIKPIKYGLNSGNDIYATDVNIMGLPGSACTINITSNELGQDISFPVQIPLPGDYMVMNALAAAAIGHLMGLTGSQIAEGIGSVRPLAGRGNIINKGGLTIIDDCYNANPMSMKAALELLSKADTRRIAVLGDMFELGENEHALHERVGAYSVGRADVLMCVGSLSADMAQGARRADSSGEMNILHYDTIDAALDGLRGLLEEGDTVLVKASNSMNFKRIVNHLLE